MALGAGWKRGASALLARLLCKLRRIPPAGGEMNTGGTTMRPDAAVATVADATALDATAATAAAASGRGHVADSRHCDCERSCALEARIGDHDGGDRAPARLGVSMAARGEIGGET